MSSAEPGRDPIDELVRAVGGSANYRAIAPAFVRRVAVQEQAKGRGAKDTLKAVKNKLHQVGGAYLASPPPYARWTAALAELPTDRQDPSLRQTLRGWMTYHASTRERLPILDEFYARSLESIAPLHSVLDLACGLNPLAVPWMPLAPGSTYLAGDIYLDLGQFLTAFLAHLDQPGEAGIIDLTDPGSLPSGPEGKPFHLALLLKTLPCLEQVDKAIAPRLLDAIPAEWILVSFPAQSLGGRSKGMVENYGARFEELLGQLGWPHQRFEFSTELAYLVRKGES